MTNEEQQFLDSLKQNINKMYKTNTVSGKDTILDEMCGAIFCFEHNRYAKEEYDATKEEKHETLAQHNKRVVETAFKETWQERLIKERNELQNKIHKLVNFLNQREEKLSRFYYGTWEKKEKNNESSNINR